MIRTTQPWKLTKARPQACKYCIWVYDHNKGPHWNFLSRKLYSYHQPTNMYVREGDIKAVNRYVKLIPETMKAMLVTYLGYSEELASFLVNLMTCANCSRDLNTHWKCFITTTFNKCMANKYCYYGNYTKKRGNFRY